MMWRTLAAYLPGWEVLVQAVIVFLVPFVLSIFYGRISKQETER
ncbi:hypothetical protein PAECIP111893_04510 [Paenibacillus plantiphilus]|uniref:Uncharacterized protein n=1 Tax=Paenibacillus plantiphilus TaxID=2905650 RepID=A0ABM9CN41_9BACL|nr:hypothetical protein PAECIP111893_04510 [Paenibacillus plantiphilus]